MKKITVILLCIITLFSCVSLSAFAEVGSNRSVQSFSVLAAAKAPTKVSGLSITASSKSKQLKLSWKAQKGVNGYQIYRSATNKKGSFKKIATLSSKKQSYTDTKLKDSTTYYYAVRAYKKSGKNVLYGSFAKTNLSTRVSKTFVKKKVERANYLFCGWLDTAIVASNYFDLSDSISVKKSYGRETYFRIKSKEFKTVKQIKSAVSKCVSGKVKSEAYKMIDDIYTERNGKLYGIGTLGQGGGGEPSFTDKITLKLNKVTDKTCTFTVTAHSSMYPSYSQRFTLRYKDGMWLYDEYPFCNNELCCGDVKITA